MGELVINSISINGIEGKSVVGIKNKQHSSFCLNHNNVGLFRSNNIGIIKPDPSQLDALTSIGSGLTDFMFYIKNPMELLKILAQVCIDLSFSVTSIVAICALCMFVFTGCKDKKPLQYVGLAVVAMYIISVIFTAFIAVV